MNKLLISIVICLLIHILISRYYESRLLSGFWVADYSFLEQSGLKMLSIMIDEGFFTKSCYIIMVNQNGILLNQASDVSFSSVQLVPWITTRHYHVEFDLDAEFFPNKQTATFYPYEGKLILYDGDTTTAVLYKDTSIGYYQDNAEQPSDEL